MPTLEFDWFILLLRVLFIFLLYFFLYQVLRVTSRELLSAATATSDPRQSPAPVGRMVVVDGAESNLPPGTSFPLHAVTTIGRHPNNAIAIDEPFVSYEHAELTYNDRRWWLRDLQSTNGTFVNGNPVTVVTGIRAGDVVQFGRIKLQLVL